MLFDRLKFVSSALLGLALGVVIALPLFWVGVKGGVGRLRQAAVESFDSVERRQQNMADECLRLEQQFARVGVKVPKKDFAKVELLRSRLAGSGDFEDKIELSQDLESALVNVETTYRQAMAADKKARDSAYLREFGLNWGPLKRYLVDEEYHFTAAVKSYNSVLVIPPVPFVIGHKSFAALVGSLIFEIRHRVGEYLRQALAWMKYGPKLAYSRIFHKPEPPRPEPMAPAPVVADPFLTPLPEPYYIAQAPVPEEDYPELQYDRDYPNMADVEVGQQKAELENKAAEPYAAPVPTLQKTVTY